MQEVLLVTCTGNFYFSILEGRILVRKRNIQYFLGLNDTFNVTQILWDTPFLQPLRDGLDPLIGVM